MLYVFEYSRLLQASVKELALPPGITRYNRGGQDHKDLKAVGMSRAEIIIVI